MVKRRDMSRSGLELPPITSERSSSRMIHDAPSAAEIRAALDRIIASNSLRGSPQLIEFLRFVVHATLRGESARLKGYTIGTAALGRDASFDPIVDPIVRVEAGRLRRALKHYYLEIGQTEQVVIDIPRGSYVPTFSRRLVDEHTPTPSTKSGGMPVAPSDHSIERVIPAAVPTSTLAAGNFIPLIFVRSFEVVGALRASAFTPNRLRNKLRDALARFDEINVLFEPPKAHAHDRRSTSDALSLPNEYHIDATVEHCADATVNLTIRLVDVTDGIVVWSGAFDIQPAADSGTAEDSIVRDVATTVAQPFGVIFSRERSKSSIDPRYASLVKALDYMRGFDLSLHDDVRTSLERATQSDPNFALGFAVLTFVYDREHYSQVGVRPNDLPAVDRMVQTARRAVALKPQSARAHEALLSAYYASGQIEDALVAGERSVALNPLDPLVLADYGIRLIGAGQSDRGEPFLNRALALGTLFNQPYVEFFAFLVAYLKKDFEVAARRANLMTSDVHSLCLVARILVAVSRGDHHRAQQVTNRLASLYPAWGDDPKWELQRWGFPAEIVERLTHDLATAGLG